MLRSKHTAILQYELLAEPSLRKRSDTYLPKYLRISNALRLNGQNPQGAGRTLFPACSTRVCYGAPLVKVLICVFQFGYEYRGYPRIE